MTDAEREGIVPTGAGVGEGVIAPPAARWQLKRSGVVDGIVDDLVVEQRRDVGAELGEPLVRALSGSAAISLAMVASEMVGLNCAVRPWTTRTSSSSVP